VGATDTARDGREREADYMVLTTDDVRDMVGFYYEQVKGKDALEGENDFDEWLRDSYRAAQADCPCQW
jgi:hypothetical protein